MNSIIVILYVIILLYSIYTFLIISEEWSPFTSRDYIGFLESAEYIEEKRNYRVKGFFANFNKLVKIKEDPSGDYLINYIYYNKNVPNINFDFETTNPFFFDEKLLNSSLYDPKGEYDTSNENSLYYLITANSRYPVVEDELLFKEYYTIPLMLATLNFINIFI